jgi:hypothetical protein
MGTESAPPLWRFLPKVALATFLVAVCPALAVLALDASGTVESPVLLIVLGLILTLGLASGGRAYWQTRPASQDLLFNELMAWGWLRRWRIERRLANAINLLGLKQGGAPRRADIAKLAPQRQARLLEDLAEALEARDPYTHGHSRRVARHASMIARRMGLPRREVTKVRSAAAVHDVGKLETPIEVLHKAAPLTDEEFETIKLHSVHGARLVRPVFGEELAAIVEHHHERLDGTGYPEGLAGDSIPLGARIIAVADTFDAITSTRPYRSAKPHKLALDVLRREAGNQLDPAAVKAFCDAYSGFRPLAIWAGISNVPQRLVYPLIGQAGSAGGAASAAKVMAATAATAAVGGAAVAHPDLAESLQSMLSTQAPAERVAAVTDPQTPALVGPETDRAGRATRQAFEPGSGRAGERAEADRRWPSGDAARPPTASDEIVEALPAPVSTKPSSHGSHGQAAVPAPGIDQSPGQSAGIGGDGSANGGHDGPAGGSTQSDGSRAGPGGGEASPPAAVPGGPGADEVADGEATEQTNNEGKGGPPGDGVDQDQGQDGGQGQGHGGGRGQGSGHGQGNGQGQGASQGQGGSPAQGGQGPGQGQGGGSGPSDGSTGSDGAGGQGVDPDSSQGSSGGNQGQSGGADGGPGQSGGSTGNEGGSQVGNQGQGGGSGGGQGQGGSSGGSHGGGSGGGQGGGPGAAG